MGFFLLRIAVKKAHIWILRIFMIATVLFSTAFALIVIFQCNPISAWWTLERKGCIDAVVIANVVYAASAVNSVADWLFASLPVFMVWKLNQPRKMKILIAGILSLAAMFVLLSTILPASHPPCFANTVLQRERRNHRPSSLYRGAR